MTGNIAGFPFWKLAFDKDGKPTDPSALVQFKAEVKNAGITDLFIFSHGWNNDATTAEQLYEGMFGEMRKILNAKPLPATSKIGTAGVFWPSILWPEDVPGTSGGAAGFGDASTDLSSEMKKVFQEPRQQEIVDRLVKKAETQTPTDAALDAFIDDLQTLLKNQSQGPEFHDLEVKAASASNDDWRQILDLLADSGADDGTQGGAAGFGDVLGRLWRGAKPALRVATYWQMKARAGVVGRTGLGPLINQLIKDVPDLRVHLLGHSFGARVVSYTLPELQIPAGKSSPVKSLFLVQGAFSHFAFAASLPFDASRKGDLAGMSDRVDGPLLTTFSELDLAVGYAYPAASILAREDASGADDLMYRWQGMGHDGAQAVNAASALLGEPPCTYNFQKGKWLNLDANDVIQKGGPPSGAHSDIIHPQVAWAALKASGVL